MPRRALAAKWIDLLRDGSPWLGGDKPEHVGKVLDLATAMLRAGWDFPDFEEAMNDGRRNKLAEQFQHKFEHGRPSQREHGAASYLNQLLKTWAKAKERVANSPHVLSPAEALQHLGLVQASIAEHHWTGRTARADHELLTLLVEIAHERRTASPSVSVRALWERSTIRSLRTVVVGLQRLRADGWFTVEDDNNPLHPRAYRLRVRQLASVLLKGQGMWVDSADASWRTPPRTDVTLALAVGRTSAAIYAGLDATSPQTKTALARVTGVGRRSLDRWLPDLESRGLACHVEGGWLRGHADPEVVGASGGGATRAYNREHRIKAQRALRDERLTWNAEREAAVARSREAESRARRNAELRRTRTSDSGEVTQAPGGVDWPDDATLAQQDPGDQTHVPGGH